MLFASKPSISQTPESERDSDYSCRFVSCILKVNYELGYSIFLLSEGFSPCSDPSPDDDDFDPTAVVSKDEVKKEDTPATTKELTFEELQAEEERKKVSRRHLTLSSILLSLLSFESVTRNQF